MCTSSSLVMSGMDDRLVVNQRIHLCVTLLISTQPTHLDTCRSFLRYPITCQHHPRLEVENIATNQGKNCSSSSQYRCRWLLRLACDVHPAMVVDSRLSQVSRKTPVGNLNVNVFKRLDSFLLQITGPQALPKKRKHTSPVQNVAKILQRH